jgi:hypothetical protein
MMHDQPAASLLARPPCMADGIATGRAEEAAPHYYYDEHSTNK